MEERNSRLILLDLARTTAEGICRLEREVPELKKALAERDAEVERWKKKASRLQAVSTR